MENILEELAIDFYPAGDDYLERIAFKRGYTECEERSYSEEDLREAFRQGQLNIEYDTVFGFTLTLDEEVWFERWKKK